MKFTSIVLLSLFSVSAMAADAQLTFTRKSGPINPRFRSTTECTILNNKVTKITRGGYGSNIARETRTAWTASVANPRALLTLLNAASRGNVRTTQGPIGGPTSTWQGLIVGVANARYAPVLLQKMGSSRLVNTSPAAAKLVEFIDFNCNRQ